MNPIGLQVLLVAHHRQAELRAPALPAVQPPAAALVEAAGGSAGRRPQNRPRAGAVPHGVLGEVEQAAGDPLTPEVGVDVEVGDVGDPRRAGTLLAVLTGGTPGGKRREGPV